MAVEKDGVPASGWAYTPDKEKTSTWKLNISDSTHTSAAVAALGKGFRGNKVEIPEEDLPAVKRKVKAAYKKFFPDNELPDIIKAAELSDMFSALIEKFFGNPSSEDTMEIVNEEMISYEVVYEPDTKDAHEQWMSVDTINKACENFNKNLKAGVVQSNLFHLENTDLFVVEDTWVQKELDVKVVQTDEIIKAGTWISKVKYNDKTLWNLRKQGVIGGVSICGSGQINAKTGEITNVTFDGE